MPIDPIAYLRERIDEERLLTLAASAGPWSFSTVASVGGGGLYDQTRVIANVVYEQLEDHDGQSVRHLLSAEADANGAHVARWDPDKVLRHCESRAAALWDHEVSLPTEFQLQTGDRVCSTCGQLRPRKYPCNTVRALLAPYSDRPDFDPRWRF